MKCPRFPGFYQHHLTNSYYKKTFEELWDKEFEILNNTCSHKFRETTDVNQWLMKEWQIASGNFDVRSHKFGKSYFIDRDGFNIVKDAAKYIYKQKGKMISINDGKMSEKEFTSFINSMINSLNHILPYKSTFEK